MTGLRAAIETRGARLGVQIVNIKVANAAPAELGGLLGFKGDLSRGERVGRVSSE